jgi:hypothetical protein
VKKNGIELINTPVYTADQNKEKQVLKVKVGDDNSISGEGNFYYTGSQYDYTLGFTGLNPKEKNDALRNSLDVLNFEKVEMKNFVNDKDKAFITYDIDFKASNFAKKAGNSLIFRAVPIYNNTIYKTEESRELPFEIRQSFEDEYEINFTIPKGYKIDEAPEDINLKSEFGYYNLSFVKNGEEIKVKRKVQVNKGMYTKEKYNEYVGFRKKIINMDNSKILITKI